MAENKDKTGLSADNGSVVIGGNVQGSNIVVGNNNTVSSQSINIASLFDKIHDVVDQQAELKPAEKEDVNAELQEIHSELEKPEPDEGFLARRFRNIKRMSPEIVEVAIETLKNPVSGVVEIIKRVSKRMAQDAK